MKSEIKILTLSNQSPPHISWQNVIDDFSKKHSVESASMDNVNPLEVKELNELIKDKDIILIDRELRTSLSRLVQHRSVSSHFIQYFDYLEKREGRWWGYSVYTSIFYQVMVNAIKNKDYKGSVIFLGANPLVLPIMEVLTGFGFVDFVFLDSEDNDSMIPNLAKHTKGFIGIKVSVVDSTAFIQSQQEYSLCFVMNQNYSRQILDDMSYFHFLSSQSIVFDVVGSQNFLFKEVKALGVDIIENGSIVEQSQKAYLSKMEQFARDIG